MSLNFFKKHYPNADYLSCATRSRKFVELIKDQGLFLELGVGWGANIRNFKQAGWHGEIIGCDLWKRFEKPTDLDGVTLVEGDVRNTLPSVLSTVDSISLLSIDLDGDVDATIFSLDQCKDLLGNGYLYIDELFGFDNWEQGIVNQFAMWLAVNVESYDVAFITDNSVAFKIGGPYSPDHLMISLLEYTTESA